MSIESYCRGVIHFYIGLMLLFLCIGVVGIWYKIRKRPFKYWWIIPYSLLYLYSAQILTFTAYLAYDDPSDPNYKHYKGWELKDFILSDIKWFAIWLFIGALLLLVSKKGSKKINFALHCIIGVLGALAVLVILLGITSQIAVSP